MKPHSHSLSTIIESFNFPEEIRAHILANHSTGNFETEDELFQFIRKIGNQGGMDEKAENIVFDLEERINIIKHKLKFIEESKKPSVLFLSEVNPPVVEPSHYLAHLTRIAGAKIYDAKLTEGKIFNPEVIIVISEHMDQVFGNLPTLLSLPEWKNTAAVQNNQVFLIDGQQHFKGFDISIASDIEILGEIFYPQYLTFGGKGETWVQFEM